MNIQAILWWSALLATSTVVAHVIEVDDNNGSDDPSCYSDNGKPCKTLDYALVNLISSTTIRIHKGQYYLKFVNTSFYNMKGIAITGAGYDVTTVECDFGTGLSFFNTDNLTLANFTLFGGGQIMNSTSVNTTSGGVAVFRVALYLSECTNVTIDGLMITNSTGTGMALFDVTGKVEIIHSLFLYNKPLDSEDLPGGGGAFIAFTYHKYTRDTLYNVQNCLFDSNTASSGDTRMPIPLPLTSVHQFGYGGGLHFMVRGFFRNNSFTIQDSSFLHNSAVWGGGLSIALFDYSKGNRVTITNVHYEDNYLPYEGSENTTTATGGGAIRIAILPNLTLEYTTSISIISCVFVSNSALFGGGISFELKKENVASTTSIHIANCTWHNNVGRLGSALDVYSHTYPLGEPADFTIDSCSFIDNTNHYTDLFFKPLGLGTVYSWSVPIKLRNKNVFIGNYGSALVGVSTQYYFQNGAITVFENNTAENGGAITLLENSHLILSNNIELNFTHNVAAGRGGAIHVVNTGQRTFISSHHCFVVYEDPTVSPYKWTDKNITVSFSHNSAKYGNSIFTTSLLPCVWEEVEGLKKINLHDVKQVFYWNKTFNYEKIFDINELEKEISSEAVYVQNFSITESFPPGKLYNFKFKVDNDRMEEAQAVYFVTTNDSTVAVVDDAESYSNGYTKLYGEPESVFDVELTTTGNLPLSILLNVKLTDCPPGFYPDGITPNETVCKCSVNVPGREYVGIFGCDNTELVAYLKVAHYAGYRNKVLLTSSCLQGYCEDQGSYIQLPSYASNEALDDLICKPQHRTGTLCGKCAEGYYVYANSPNFKCGPCTIPLGLEILYYIVSKCLMLFIFVLIIGIFNISLVDGPLNSFILFSQLLPYMDIYAGNRINIPNQNVVTAYRFLYGIWNLNFAETLIPYICLHQSRSALVINMLDLIPIALVVVVTLTISRMDRYYCCRNCRVKSIEFVKKCAKKFTCKIVGGVMWCFNTVMKYEFMKQVVNSIRKCIFNSQLSTDHNESGSSINTVDDHDQQENNNQSGGGENNNQSGGGASLMRIGPLISIIILCYARVTVFGFVSLSFSKLYGPSKDDSDDFLLVFRYDGTLKYTEHIHFVLIGILAIFLVLLIPFTLIIFPFKYVFKCWHNCPCTCIYYLCWSVHNKPKWKKDSDDRGSFEYTCCCSRNAHTCNYLSCNISHMFDELQRCYKNNNFVNARITALYLLHRLIILGIYAFTPSIELQYLQQSVCFIVMLIVHSVFQPYKDDIYNVVDTCVFGNLALISAISYYRLYSDAEDLVATSKSFIIQTILIFLPFLCLVLLCCRKAYKIYVDSQPKEQGHAQTDRGAQTEIEQADEDSEIDEGAKLV